MYADRPFDPDEPDPAHARQLDEDLGLETIIAAMGGGDPFVENVSRSAVHHSLLTPADILFRQDVFADVLAHERVVRELYQLAEAGIDADEHIHIGIGQRRPSVKVARAADNLTAFWGVLRRLRTFVDRHGVAFRSEGLATFSAMVHAELDDDFLDAVEGDLRLLGPAGGVLASARLGVNNQGTDYVLRRTGSRWVRLSSRLVGSRPGRAVTIPGQDFGALDERTDLLDQAMWDLAPALTRASDHVLQFFRQLRVELAFYIGALNLYRAFEHAGLPACPPVPAAANEIALTARGLVDPVLALQSGQRLVANDVTADGSNLVVITGANQGGKSTLLRALGIAQVLMQAGVYVAADRFRGSVAAGVHTHFRREEDATMTRGRFDEELERMSDVVDTVRPHWLVLCNESFAATNEREAALVGGEVIGGLLDADVRVFLVTNLYELAQRLAVEGADFLRAERSPDGTRPFKIVPGAPTPTSHGRDLYVEVFGTSDPKPTDPSLPDAPRLPSASLRDR
jgi:hypothetical protein